ncbi:MAG: glycine cleavage system protein H [Bradyrhizobiaceae bacterium]|nr:glycine cleavage system protein H [Bradyrhizobiaceae bacterium]
MKVRGCEFPDHLFYDVPHHTWYAPVEGGLLRAGMTIIGVALAREVLVFTPKRAGRSFEKGRAFATVESAKWVGSVRAAFDGEVVAVNDDAIRNPALVNDDCYGAGWLLVAKPADDSWRAALVTGDAMAGAYEAWMESEAFAGCGRN